MLGANQVRVTKIKVKKDKVGLKWATIELTRPLDESDSYTSAIRSSIDHMRSNEKVTNLKLNEQVTSRNLIFFAALGIDKASEMFTNIEITNFKLKREESEDRDWLMLTFDFTVPLEDARRWIIPSIGDDILCVVEAPISFPKE